jgi:sulfatase modifying factor 1
MVVLVKPGNPPLYGPGDASAEVGFRCAMTMVGAPEIHPEGKPHYRLKKLKAYKAR